MKDADKLVLGYMLVFLYVNLMLSKLNCVEQVSANASVPQCYVLVQQCISASVHA